MPSITGTLALGTEFAGSKKLLALTAIPISSDDTMTLTQAVHGISSLDSIVGATLTGGADAMLNGLQVSITSAANMTIQVKTFNGSGAAATDWTGATVAIGVIGNV